MQKGVAVGRHCVITLRNHDIAIDWGNNTFQNVHTAEFITVNEGDVSHTTIDSELDLLVKSGMVESYDSQTAYFLSLPELPRSTLD